MRLLGCLALAACYAPSIAEQIPCGAGEACPQGQRCHDGRCYETPPIDAALDAEIDAPPDAAPVTCAGPDSVLDVACTSVVSNRGFFFDVEAKSPIGITGFSIMARAGGRRDMRIYYRRGTHVGFETTAAQWTLLGSASNFSPASAQQCPLPVTLIPITFCVPVSAGERVAFYIVTTDDEETSIEGFPRPLGEVVIEDASLRLYAGRMQDRAGAFAGTLVEGQGFQGVIHTSR